MGLGAEAAGDRHLRRWPLGRCVGGVVEGVKCSKRGVEAPGRRGSSGGGFAGLFVRQVALEGAFETGVPGVPEASRGSGWGVRGRHLRRWAMRRLCKALSRCRAKGSGGGVRGVEAWCSLQGALEGACEVGTAGDGVQGV
jgi:hypothetical protein